MASSAIMRHDGLETTPSDFEDFRKAHGPGYMSHGSSWVFQDGTQLGKEFLGYDFSYCPTASGQIGEESTG